MKVYKVFWNERPSHFQLGCSMALFPKDLRWNEFKILHLVKWPLFVFSSIGIFRPSRSTSSVLKSAFQTLNPRDYENEIAMQQRINYLESWLTSLQQEVNQQRSYINWLCNEHQVLKQLVNFKEPDPLTLTNIILYHNKIHNFPFLTIWVILQF